MGEWVDKLRKADWAMLHVIVLSMLCCAVLIGSCGCKDPGGQVVSLGKIPATQTCDAEVFMLNALGAAPGGTAGAANGVLVLDVTGVGSMSRVALCVDATPGCVAAPPLDTRIWQERREGELRGSCWESESQDRVGDGTILIPLTVAATDCILAGGNERCLRGGVDE